MRITQGMMYNTYINDIVRRQETLYSLDKQLATGKRVNAPSDDPVNAGTILSSKSVLSSFNQYQRNIDSGYSYLNITEKALSSVKDVITSVKEIATTNATGTMDAVGRANSASIVSNLLDELVSLGNTEFDGRYVFSGYKTDTPALSATGAYQGDSNRYGIRISGTSTLTVGVNGDEVFKGAGGGGGTDILQTVSDLVTALAANDVAGIEASIGALDSSFNQVTAAVAEIGGKVNRLQSAEATLSTTRLEVSATVSNLEDADVASVISELKLGQIALEAALSSAGTVFSTNIFNYI
ncbi:MAG: flagellar hook-associated protein FlgL [Thermodesulfobacteriota bacterium]